MPNYSVQLDFSLDEEYSVVAFYPIKDNGCCNKRFFILTANSCPNWETGINYSCQCACGGWCTTGFKTEQEAVEAYRNMCKQKEDKE